MLNMAKFLDFTIKSSAPSYSMTSRSTMGSFHEDLRKVCMYFYFSYSVTSNILYSRTNSS